VLKSSTGEVENSPLSISNATYAHSQITETEDYIYFFFTASDLMISRIDKSDYKTNTANLNTIPIPTMYSFVNILGNGDDK